MITAGGIAAGTELGLQAPFTKTAFLLHQLTANSLRYFTTSVQALNR